MILLGMNKEQIMQAVNQKMQFTTDFPNVVAEIMEENNKLIAKQVEDMIETKARTRNHPFDLV